MAWSRQQENRELLAVERSEDVQEALTRALAADPNSSALPSVAEATAMLLNSKPEQAPQPIASEGTVAPKIDNVDIITLASKAVGVDAPEDYDSKFGNNLSGVVEKLFANSVDFVAAELAEKTPEEQAKFTETDFLNRAELVMATAAARQFYGTKEGELPTQSETSYMHSVLLGVAPAAAQLDKELADNREVDPNYQIPLVYTPIPTSQQTTPEQTTPQQTAVAAADAPKQYETVPDRVITAENRADIENVQRLMGSAISNVNGMISLDMGRGTIYKELLGIDKSLPEMPAPNGIMDAETEIAYGSVMDLLMDGNDLKEKYGDKPYNSEIGEELSESISQLGGARKKIMDKILGEDDRESLIASMDRLSSDDALRPVTMIKREIPAGSQETLVASTTSADGVDKTAVRESPVNLAASNSGGVDDPKDKVKDAEEPKVTEDRDILDDVAIETVEEVLFELGSELDNMPGLGGMLSKLDGIRDSVLKPIGKDEIGGEFGSGSQDLASKLVMGMKMLAGDANANGKYTAAIGDNLRVSVLTNPNFEFIRDQIEKRTGTSFEALAGKTDAHKAHINNLLNFDKSEPAKPADDASEEVKKQYTDTMAVRTKFAATNEKDLENVKYVNRIFDSMDRLQDKGIYDNKEAEKVNQTNIMLDAAGVAMDQWAPALKGFLKDFFTNNEFGQMIAGVLSQFMGVNIGRLWGDNDDAGALDRSLGLVGKGFDSLYKQAEESDDIGSDAKNAEIVGKASEIMTDKMTKTWSGLAATKGLGVILGTDNKDAIRNALETAMDKAALATNKDDAKAEFMDSLQASSASLKAGVNIDASKNTAVKSEADLVAATNAATEAGQTNTPGHNAIDKVAADKANANAEATSEASSSAPDRDMGQRAVDASAIKAGDNTIELVYVANNDEWTQGDWRYSYGRFGDIQEILGNNAEELGLSLNTEGMKIDGQYSDMATPYTCAVIEETLIRAQIHEFLADPENEGKELTQEILDGFDRKLSADNLDTVMTYMRDQGVSEADITKFAENVTDLDGDHFSTDFGNRELGPEQEASVLDQVLITDQFKFNVTQPAPETNNLPVSKGTGSDQDRYLDQVAAKNCEDPLFFMKEGSDSVFAIIRDKSTDASDPKSYKELEFIGFQKSNAIQTKDITEGDVKALTDNYVFDRPDAAGIRDVINKVLGLEPSEHAVGLIEQRGMTVEDDRVGFFPANKNTFVVEPKVPPPADLQKQEVHQSDIQKEFTQSHGCNDPYPITTAVKDNIWGPIGKQLSVLPRQLEGYFFKVHKRGWTGPNNFTSDERCEAYGDDGYGGKNNRIDENTDDMNTTQTPEQANTWTSPDGPNDDWQNRREDNQEADFGSHK